MNFDRKIFWDYFNKRISRDELAEKIQISSPLFQYSLLMELQKNYDLKDPEMIEFLLYALFLWDENQQQHQQQHNYTHLFCFEDILNKLLIADWHTQHEDIVWLLQNICDKNSVMYLYQAISLKPSYLDWDDNYAFPLKCIRAIGRIGGKEAIDCLVVLQNDPNPILADVAKRKLKELL